MQYKANLKLCFCLNKHNNNQMAHQSVCDKRHFPFPMIQFPGETFIYSQRQYGNRPYTAQRSVITTQ